MRPPVLRLALESDEIIRAALASNEIIVDNFAGGGGASTGILAALGRSPDIAINHNAKALAMHKANHPSTKHYCEDVWAVDPRKVVNGKRVGLAWFSPDCKHFSKAKGGKPVDKKVRGLAWLVIRWCKAFPENRRPRVIVLENVEEFLTWGPLLANDFPDPARKGQTFRRWKTMLENLGYQVEHRVLTASEYDTPTIRKRLFLVARCDGVPIVWPEKTNGKDMKPMRSAAECIDFDIPCPSIFDRKRPLAPATMRRIAAGIKRFVLDAPEPFIVGVGGRMSQTNPRPVSMPAQTLTAKADSAVVMPVLVGIDNKSNGERDTWNADSPLKTITTENRFAVAQACLIPVTHQGDNRTYDLFEPMRTVTGAARGEQALIGATLIQTGYGERAGQAPRVPGLEKPLGTVVANGRKHALVTAFLAKHFGGMVGTKISNPLPTVTTRGTQNQVVTANLVRLYGSAKAGRDVREPLPTVTTGGGKGGGHEGVVQAFLTSYYSDGGAVRGGQLGDLRKPMKSVRTKDCLALVTIKGVDYKIVDIGMRMLTPRELFRAQGFPESYQIEKDADGNPFTKTAQVMMCGNSVCPPLARAVVEAQFGKAA